MLMKMRKLFVIFVIPLSSGHWAGLILSVCCLNGATEGDKGVSWTVTFKTINSLLVFLPTVKLAAVMVNHLPV